MDNFYTVEELKQFNFKKIGKNVKISKNCSIYFPHKMELGSNIRIDDFCILSGKISIGSYVHISASVLLFGGISGIFIDDFSSISSRSAIYSSTDDYMGNALVNPTISASFRSVTNLPVFLGKHALIGTGCTVLPGVKIGEGASIGAMSLINKDIQPWTVNIGIPVRFLKKRNKEKMQDLEKKFLEEQNEKNISY